MNQKAKTKPHSQDKNNPSTTTMKVEGTGQPILVFECAVSRDSPYVIQAICAKVQNRGWLSYKTSVWVSSRGGTTGPGLRLGVFDDYEIVTFGQLLAVVPRRSQQIKSLH